ncbi:hypothetical protein D1627_09650 [Pontibacter oryzae]|uniref:Uncharacterized protein n=1 Tax=Pontibacter oryzae TaxID=2304593 RepID=A0A399S723_9BACT|nr:hypothetical protein D1627_09650 [Pontibacter oryzae]
MFILAACSDGPSSHGSEEATVAAETGQAAPLPKDVIYAAHPLISGKLYSHPDFKAQTITYFDTSQQVYVLDTADVMFVKARVSRDTTSYTGYITKTILPERQREVKK